jgi:para-nitrobenzyl esterase
MSIRVETQDGWVEGEQRAGHLAFRGIPFARPPLGSLRFRAPEPVVPWPGTLDAREFAASAPQSNSELPWMEAQGPRSEDCLYLNVVTPSRSGKRPVMVWIHGGGFELGSGSSPVYDGGPLAERGDVVVVTINYRLGALGYLYLGAAGGERFGASANLGQLDQIAALRWVRENIAAFGGDPGNVTIFGESAGSIAVCTLLAMPAARGLFHRAVAQSGAWLEVQAPEAAAETSAAYLRELGISSTQTEALQELDVVQLLAAQHKVGLRLRGGLGFCPVLDPASVPLHPRDAFARGEAAQVPLVIGTNRDELNLFRMGSLRELDKPMENARAIALLQNQLPSSVSEHVPRVLEAYRASRARRGLPHGNRALLGAIQSDVRFRLPSIQFAEAYRAVSPRTFMYLFTYESPALDGALRACHALELPFVFGTLHAPFQDRFAGRGPAVEALSETMMACWLTFARSGDPTHPRAGDWIPYDPTRRATLVFDTDSKLEDAPYEEERSAWPPAA